jgi:hypothetical protein
MPTPSLLIVPARFKSGKLYSQLPTSGAGDFTVTRATNATRVNASGLIESVASGIPRLDYFASGGTVGCPALLVEPSGSNLVLQSENFLTSWTPTNVSVTTGTTAAFTSPSGTTNADLITATSTSPSFVGQNLTIAFGTYTISVFAKAGNYGLFRIGNVSSVARSAWFNLDAGAVTGTVNGGTASMQNYGNGWYRCIYTSSGMVSGNPTVFFAPSDSPNGTNAVSGSSIYFWGAQLETGSVATSYIPTTTGSVTRNADVVSVSGAVSGSIGQLSGTIYAEVDVQSAFLGAILTIDDGDTSDFISILRLGNFQIRARIRRANSTITSIITSAAVSVGTHKIALAYTNGDYALYIDGVNAGTSTNSTDYPATSLTQCVLSNTSYVPLNDRIRAAALYTTRLTDAELAALTSL